VAFLEQARYDFASLVRSELFAALVLPFKNPVQVHRCESRTEMGYLAALKKLKIGSNLDLLEIGRTAEGGIRSQIKPNAPEAVQAGAGGSRLA
jgi:hypothetical protein